MVLARMAAVLALIPAVTVIHSYAASDVALSCGGWAEYVLWQPS